MNNIFVIRFSGFTIHFSSLFRPEISIRLRYSLSAAKVLSTQKYSIYILQWISQRTATRGRLHKRPVHGGRALGHSERLDRGLPAQGALPPDAGGLHQGHHPGQAGHEEHVRLPGVQDALARPHLRLDLQPQDPGQANQVDVSRCSHPPADLSGSRKRLFVCFFCSQ